MELDKQPIDSWKDNRRFRCVVVRSIDWNMVVSPYNNNYYFLIFQVFERQCQLALRKTAGSG
jgi:hypothetical protein